MSVGGASIICAYLRTDCKPTHIVNLTKTKLCLKKKFAKITRLHVSWPAEVKELLGEEARIEA